MLALGIALVLIALLSPASVSTVLIWLFGIAALGFYAGRRAAEPNMKGVDKDV